MLRVTAASLFVLGLLATPTAARADVPPPDTCSRAGESCTNGGPTYDQPGTCTSAKCNRATPSGPVEYDCLRCIPSGGTGGAPSTGAGGAPSTGAGGASTGTGGASTGTGGAAPTETGDTGSGCSMSTAPHDARGAWALAALGLGLVALRRGRRR